MKIRTQMYIFIAGLIFIPFFVLCVTGLMAYNNQPERMLLPGYEEISELSVVEIKEHDWEIIARRLSRMPSNVEVAVLTPQNVSIFSTIEELPQNQTIDDGLLMKFIRSTNDKYYYQIDRPGRPMDENFIVVTRMHRFRPKRPSFMVQFYTMVLVIFVVIIVFCSVALWVIARSITNSITALDKATKQISLGKLDEEIVVKGSNEITSLTENLNSMRLTLKENQTRRSRFIMGVSHDLRTPIALIKGYTEALADGTVDQPEMQKKSLQIVLSKIAQLEDMINELIDFVKLDTGEWRQNLQNASLLPFLQEFAERFTSDANLMGRSVQTKIELDENIQVAFDERLFLRCLENLTGNAIRYTQKGGTIGLKAFADGSGFVKICICDNGIGIDQKDLPYIFDIFYRGSNSRREKGSGLGLSVVKTIVESHGWQISASSRLEEGTEFVISIPLN